MYKVLEAQLHWQPVIAPQKARIPPVWRKLIVIVVGCVCVSMGPHQAMKCTKGRKHEEKKNGKEDFMSTKHIYEYVIKQMNKAHCAKNPPDLPPGVVSGGGGGRQNDWEPNAPENVGQKCCVRVFFFITIVVNFFSVQSGWPPGICN